MTITTAQQKENLSTAYANAAAYVSFHTADPGSTGANEVAGTRAVISWTPGSTDGIITGTATGSVSAGTVITHVGLWTAASGGTFLDKVAGSATSTGTINVTLTFTQT